MFRWFGLVKIHRFIIKNFGNYRNFIAWCLAVALAVFAIDSLLTPRVAHPKVHQVIYNSPEGTFRTVVPGADIKENEEPEIKEEKPVKKNPVVHPKHCGVATPCPRGKFSYYIKSGYGRDVSATMCFNENYIVAEDRISSERGLNLVVVNDATLNVEEIKVFDVYKSDASLIEYMRKIEENYIILVTSHDEASFNLSAASREEFHKFGSSVLDTVNFRDNYAIVGQKGIPIGQAIEGHQPRNEGVQFAETVVITGCITIPVGRLKGEPPPIQSKAPPQKPPPVPKPGVKVEPVGKVGAAAESAKVDKRSAEKAAPTKKAAVVDDKKQPPAKKDKSDENFGEELKNCGVTSACSDNGFPVHLYTGFQGRDPPKICVDGKYVMGPGLNDAGRGLNFVVIDPTSREVTRAARFDTYSSDDNTIELFVEMLNEGDIILCVAHDEASMKLEKTVRDLLEGVGSSFVSRLSFRDVWAFVGQKGIVGYSPLEDFEFSDADSERQVLSWPRPIDRRFCVPKKLSALKKKKVPTATLR